MVRATAVSSLSRKDPTMALEALRDTSGLVRRAAMDCLIDGDRDTPLTDGLEISLAQGRIDTLVDGMRRAPYARGHLLSLIERGQLSRLEMLTALEAIAAE